MTQPAEEMFDAIIIHMAAWRRLRHSIEETRKKDPEKYNELANALLQLMDMAYNEAAADLRKQKASMEHQLKKARENSGYGKVNE